MSACLVTSTVQITKQESMTIWAAWYRQWRFGNLHTRLYCLSHKCMFLRTNLEVLFQEILKRPTTICKKECTSNFFNINSKITICNIINHLHINPFVKNKSQLCWLSSLYKKFDTISYCSHCLNKWMLSREALMLLLLSPAAFRTLDCNLCKKEILFFPQSRVKCAYCGKLGPTAIPIIK